MGSALSKLAPNAIGARLSLTARSLALLGAALTALGATAVACLIRRRDSCYLGVVRPTTERRQHAETARENADANETRGLKLDVFREAPAMQRKLLADLQGVHNALIDISGLKVELSVSPVMNARGKRIGSIAQWSDQAALQGIEVEIEGVVRAAASGDFRRHPSDDFARRMRGDHEGSFKVLADSVNQTGRNLEELMSQIRASS